MIQDRAAAEEAIKKRDRKVRKGMFMEKKRKQE